MNGRKDNDFNNKTKKLLAESVGYHCSNPECRVLTIAKRSDDLKSICIGIACHISAASSKGPRYNDAISSVERSSYSNGIWLCSNCSKLIDTDVSNYSVDTLKYWKEIAENDAYAKISSQVNLDSQDTCLMKLEIEHENDIYNIIQDIKSILNSCRSTFSWDDKSELKLYSWLEEYNEEDLIDLEFKTLCIIRKNLVEYLEIHLVHRHPSYTLNNPSNMWVKNYIKNHPGTTLNQIRKYFNSSTNEIDILIKYMIKSKEINVIYDKINDEEYFVLNY